MADETTTQGNQSPSADIREEVSGLERLMQQEREMERRMAEADRAVAAEANRGQQSSANRVPTDVSVDTNAGEADDDKRAREDSDASVSPEPPAKRQNTSATLVTDDGGSSVGSEAPTQSQTPSRTNDVSLEEAVRRGMEKAAAEAPDNVVKQERSEPGIPSEITVKETKILIPVDENDKPMADIKRGAEEVKLKEFDPTNQDHLDHVAEKNSPKLIENEKTGSMLTPQATYVVTNGQYAKGKEERAANKQEAYEDKMEGLGLSPEKPDNSAKQNYKNMPDLLVAEKDESTGDLQYKAVKAKEFENLKEVQEKYETVELKTKNGSYQSPEVYDRTHEPGKGADARFEELKRTSERRDDLADVYVLDKETKNYESLKEIRQQDPDFKVDKTKELLLQTDAGTLLDPKSYKKQYGKADFEDLMEKNDIDPKDVGSKYRADKADVLVVADDGRTLKNAAKMPEESLQNLDAKDVLVQNTGKKNQPTGNYMDAERAEKYGSDKDVPGRIDKAGVTLSGDDAGNDRADDSSVASDRAVKIMEDQAAARGQEAANNNRETEPMKVEPYSNQLNERTQDAVTR